MCFGFFHFPKNECREVTVRKFTVGGNDVEFGAYDNHIHNEEVYHHLCSVKKRNTLLSQVENVSYKNLINL